MISSFQFPDKWCDAFAKTALCFFGIVLWYKGFCYYSYALLFFAWVMNFDLCQFKETIKEPIVLGITFFCFVLAAGILWSSYPDSGYIRWNKYFSFLLIVPYLSLLNKERLPWAIGGLVTGYLFILFVGVYHWFFLGEEGIPYLKMTYLRFSLTVGLGVILALYLLGKCDAKLTKLLLWVIAVLLLYVQFNQDGRGPLLTTIITSMVLIFMLYQSKIKILLGVFASLAIVVFVFWQYSERFQQRIDLAKEDVEFIQQGKYDTDLGYRFAIWDVGVHAILQRPLLGYGTGTALSTYEQYVETYKGGRYRDLWREPRFHYHNDMIEIGVFTGTLGLSAFFLLLWCWYLSLKNHQIPVLGAALVCYVFLAGLTDIFLAYTGLPLLVVAVAAVAIGWQKYNFAVK